MGPVAGRVQRNPGFIFAFAGVYSLPMSTRIGTPGRIIAKALGLGGLLLLSRL